MNKNTYKKREKRLQNTRFDKNVTFAAPHRGATGPIPVRAIEGKNGVEWVALLCMNAVAKKKWNTKSKSPRPCR